MPLDKSPEIHPPKLIMEGNAKCKAKTKIITFSESKIRGISKNHRNANSSKVWVFRPRFLYFLMTSWRDLSRAKSN